MDGYIKIGTELDTKNFDAEIKYIEGQMEDIEDKLKQADMGFEVGDTQKLEAKYSRLIKQLDRLQKKQADLNRADLNKIQDSIENISASVSKTIAKVGKWALAIFGVRSAYNFLRQSASTLAQYNDQIARDLEYMRFAVASMLQPAIEGMIQLAYKLLTYINYIAKAWFGVDLFANASTKAMEKGAKSAEKMKKSLAGFDEMNVLNDNGTTGAMGAVAPSVDLSAPENIPVPEWIRFITENKDLILATLGGISGALLAINFGLGAIIGLGIGLILAGVILLIQGIVDFLKEPTWQNFLTILEGIALIVAGIAILFGGWTVALVAFGVAIIANIVQNWDKVKQILGAVGTWVYEKVIKPIGDFFTRLWNGITDGVGKAVNWVKDKFNSVVSFFSGLIDKVVGFFSKLGTKVGDAIGGAFKLVVNGVLFSIETILNRPIKTINTLIGVINKIPGIDIGTLPTFSLPRLAVGGIVNMPSRGVQVGGAIAGEAGAEGVIPLTNSQAMETLGQAIGRYVTINANITNSMNGRVISRELKKVNASNDFAYNR